jgi:hypothetical protein
MKHDAFATSVRAFCLRKPFRPFFVEFFTGTRILISHPEAVRCGPVVTIHFTRFGQRQLFDADSVCRVIEVGID